MQIPECREGTPEIPFRDYFEYREDRLTSMPFEIQFHVLCNADHFIFHHFHKVNLGIAIQISDPCLETLTLRVIKALED